MSFLMAHLGEEFTSIITGNSSGLAMNSTQDLLELNITEGHYMFTATFSVFAGSVPANSLMSSKVTASYNGKQLAQESVNNQNQATITLSGILNADGLHNFSLTANCFDCARDGENAISWGYSDGYVNFIRVG